MEENGKMHLNSACISKVPLQIYDNDFTFIVNGEEFKTSRIISDLLSPRISQIHTIDPTFDRINIDTEQRGDFSLILKLINFTDISIQENEIEFLNEVIENLGNEFIEFLNPLESIEITKDNVFSFIRKHQKHSIIYSAKLTNEIEFITAHFFELCESNKEELISLDENILSEILSQRNLRLRDEDQILRIVNEIYQQERKLFNLYEFVIFSNVTTEAINEFIDIFDYNDINNNIWVTLSDRLKSRKIEYEENQLKHSNRYIEKNKTNKISYEHGQEMKGIIEYLTTKHGQNIEDCGIIKVTTNNFNSSNPPKNVLDFNTNNTFASSKGFQQDTWICFDFQNYEIEISNYSIKTHSSGGYAKNWVIEISDDGKNWTQIDEHKNYSELNSPYTVKTFEVHKNKFSRFCRFRHTGEYWVPNNFLRINSIEFYGEIREKL